jgi:hypothetical protein
MAKPSTRQQLIDYCLRALGAPVIEINVDEQQLEDRVDEAIQYYQEYHGDAVVRNLRKHQITQADINNGYIDIPNTFLSVNNVLDIRASGSNAGMFSVDYQMHLNDIFDLGGPYGGGLVNYEITKQYMSLIQRNINGVFEKIEFSRHKNRITFFSEETYQSPSGLGVGKYLIFDGYEVVDPDTFTDVYNDMFLKKYLTALIKRQWGTNLIKFEGMQLPGGVTLNGRQIFDDAREEITKLEEEMLLKHEMPPHFFIG